MLEYLNVGRVDEMVENAWRNRAWSSFVVLWIACSVAITILAFLIVYIPSILYLEGSRIYYYMKLGQDMISGMPLSNYMSLQYSALWNFAIKFGEVSGLMALITLIPTMIIKQLSGAVKS
jgi:hypothetical protein